MPTRHPRITITLSENTFKTITNIANSQDRKLSDVGRELLEKALNIELCTENVDFITMLMREELQNILEPYFERMIGLESKACIQSATSAYLCAETLNRFVPAGQRMDYQEAYYKAQKKALQYIRRQKNTISESDEQDED